MAQHWVLRQKRYWVLEQSYRDELGRPRKRRLENRGRQPRPDAEERALAVAERAAEKSDAWQREHLGETALERQERERSKSNLPQGLHLGPTPPVEVEKAPSPGLPSEPASADALPESAASPDAAGGGEKSES